MVSNSVESPIHYDELIVMNNTLESRSNLSVSTISFDHAESCTLISQGILLTLKSKDTNYSIQINSIKIYKSTTTPMDIEVWHSRGDQRNKFSTEKVDLSNWTKSCCDSPVMGKGRKIQINIAPSKDQPIDISLNKSGMDEFITVLIKSKHKGILSNFIGYEACDKNRIYPEENQYLDINLRSTSNRKTPDSFQKKDDQVVWNGAIEFELHTKENNINSSANESLLSDFQISNKLISSYQGSEDRKLQSCRSTHQLSTSTVGTTASYGIMFDVTPLTNLVLETIEFHCKRNRGETFRYEVYAKAGSHSNAETDAFKWTSLSEGTLHVAGRQNFTGIPNDEFTRLTMNAGQNYSLYLVSNSSDIVYGTGTEVGKIHAEDSNIQILEGVSMAAYPPFGDAIFSPRTFEGRVHYSTVEECAEVSEESNTFVTRMPTISPTMAPTACKSEYLAKTILDGKSSSFGIMFDAMATDHDLLVEGFQVRSSKEVGSQLKYSIYSKEDSYRRFETNPSVWTSIADDITLSEGRGALTTLPIALSDRILILSSKIRSFYITFHTPDLLYSAGSEEGTMYFSDDNIQIFEGIGIAEFPPFGTSFMIPRLFQGTLQYSIESECSDLANEPIASPIMPSIPSESSKAQNLSNQTIDSLSAGQVMFNVEDSSPSRTSNLTVTESNGEEIKQNTTSPTSIGTPSSEQTSIFNSSSELSESFNQTHNATLEQSSSWKEPNSSITYVDNSTRTVENTSSQGSFNGNHSSITCSILHHLNSTKNGTLSSFGNIFEVRTAGDMLMLETIGFSSIQIKGTSLNYSVFFKSGSYRQFEKNSSSWNKVSEGTVISEGKGQMTMIPLKNFDPILMEINSIHSIYFILDTPDVIYDLGSKEGQSYTTDDRIEVLEGTRIEEYPPFRSNNTNATLWLGTLVYSVIKECETEELVPLQSTISTEKPSLSSPQNLSHTAIPTIDTSETFSNKEPITLPSFGFESETEKNATKLLPFDNLHSISINFTNLVNDGSFNEGPMEKISNLGDNITSVPLKFVIENTFLNKIQSDFIMTQISEGVEKSVRKLILNDSFFSLYSENLDLELNSVVSFLNHTLEPYDSQKCLTYLNGSPCSVVNVIIHISHSENITNGQIRFSLLSRIDDLVADFEPDISMLYIGSKTEVTYAELALIGKNLNFTLINNSNIEIILEVLKSKTEEALSSNDDFDDVHINDLEVIDVSVLSNSTVHPEKSLIAFDSQEEGTLNRQREHAPVTLIELGVYLNIKSDFISVSPMDFDEAIYDSMQSVNSDVLQEINSIQSLDQITELKVDRYELTEKRSSDFDTSNDTSFSNIANVTKQGNLQWDIELILTIAVPVVFLLVLIVVMSLKRKKNNNNTGSGRSLPLQRSHSFSVSSVMRRQRDVWSRSEIEDLQYNQKRRSSLLQKISTSSKTMLSFK